MFFDSLEQLPEIATHTSCSIFVVPPDTQVNLPYALTLEPDITKKTNIISIEQIREFIALTNSRETTERYFIIRPADVMNEAAQNAFLKTFEEPKAHCHFVLLTEHPAALLPTILSRAQIFYYRTANQLNQAPQADTKTMAMAKKLISASTSDLPALATEISKVKTGAREYALGVTATAIELLYKSYFKTQNPKFLTKLPNFIQLHENLANNGHIKLHIVSDLL